jgi:hypothetical protein
MFKGGANSWLKFNPLLSLYISALLIFSKLPRRKLDPDKIFEESFPNL